MDFLWFTLNYNTFLQLREGSCIFCETYKSKLMFLIKEGYIRKIRPHLKCFLNKLGVQNTKKYSMNLNQICSIVNCKKT